MNYHDNIYHARFQMKPQTETYQVTLWDDPDSLVITGQWGTLSYRQWLAMESARWASKWRDAWLEEGSGQFDGCVALFTHKDQQIAYITPEEKE